MFGIGNHNRPYDNYSGYGYGQRPQGIFNVNSLCNLGMVGLTAGTGAWMVHKMGAENFFTKIFGARIGKNIADFGRSVIEKSKQHLGDWLPKLKKYGAKAVEYVRNLPGPVKLLGVGLGVLLLVKRFLGQKNPPESYRNSSNFGLDIFRRPKSDISFLEGLSSNPYKYI